MKHTPYKVLLLENIHAVARDLFLRDGFEVELLKGALSAAELKEKLKGVHVLGIRSKTTLTADVLKQAQGLYTVGCFCVGTNQVDLDAARALGLPVFNAPFSNTRSVAEMVIAEIVVLARKIGLRNNEMHQGIWNKSSDQCFEVRGKTLGIVGYGNIGTQVSAMAEAMGMRVLFYDILSKLPLGNAKPVATLQELLSESDFVTLHVPATPITEYMMGPDELKTMQRGAYLLNASRGNVVRIDALAELLKSGHLAGAAIDVYPEEPETNTKTFRTQLAGLPNVMLTPHIGGATEEAQGNIGREVASTLIRFIKTGATPFAVNFPRIDAPLTAGAHRLINVHKNVPGVLREINRLVSDSGANIQSQHLSTDASVGYVQIDLDQPVTDALIASIQQLPTSIRTRTLYS